MKWDKTSHSAVIYQERNKGDDLLFQLLSDADTPRAKFISTATKTRVQPKWDPHPIQELCARQTWTENVVFQCVEISGGISNVRQAVLTCIRWAIEAGAALVFPQVQLRVASNASEVIYHKYGDFADYDELFDHGTLAENLSEACPQMTVYPDVDSLKRTGAVEEVGITFDALRHARNHEMGDFVQAWIAEHKAAEGKVSLIRFAKTLAEYEVCDDGPEVADNFGQLVAFRKDTAYLASAVLYELSSRFELNINPLSSITSDSFVGIHLRSSADAAAKNWLNFDKQVSIYGAEIRKYKPHVIYVASGNLSSVALLATSLSTVPVVTKDQLLSGKELDLLNSLSWDQQGEVDLQVLLKSSQFLGMSDSSFSWAISSARRSIGKRGTCSDEERENGKPEPVERGWLIETSCRSLSDARTSSFFVQDYGREGE